MGDYNWYDLPVGQRLAVQSTQPAPISNYSAGGLASAIADGDFLPWTGHPQGDLTLLDVTDPTHPVVTRDGLLNVTVLSGPDDGVHAGKNQQIELDITTPSVNDRGPRTYATLALDSAVGIGPVTSACLTWYAPVGTILCVQVHHDIGVATDWDYNMFVQQI